MSYYEEKISELKNLLSTIEKQESSLKSNYDYLKNQEKKLNDIIIYITEVFRKNKNDIEKIIKEKSIGIP